MDDAAVRRALEVWRGGGTPQAWEFNAMRRALTEPTADAATLAWYGDQARRICAEDLETDTRVMRAARAAAGVTEP